MIGWDATFRNLVIRLGPFRPLSVPPAMRCRVAATLVRVPLGAHVLRKQEPRHKYQCKVNLIVALKWA